jgi:NADH-quinone oxidoreductase subunit C
VHEVTVVGADEWYAELASAAAAGFGFLDMLAAIDRRDAVELVAHVVDPTSREHRLLSTRVPGPEPCVASVVDVFAGANWHEREAAEMFGIRFEGHPDPRPLLTRGQGSPLLRKSTSLPARAGTAWPGADESAARRRGRTPGVLDTWDAG